MVTLAAAELERQRWPNAFIGRHRQFQIIQHGMVFEHRGFLKLAPDTGFGNGRFVEVEQVKTVAKNSPAAVGAGLAGNHVHHGGFTGAVRADDAAKLPVVNGQA